MSKSIFREEALETAVRPTAPARRRKKALPGLRLGRLVLMDAAGTPGVEFRGQDRPVAARSTVPLRHEDVGRDIVLFLDEGDPRRPVILGLLEAPGAANVVDVRSAAGRVVLSADREIVLQCGKASLTLTRAGKVLIRGAYISSRSSGVQRIKGGSVLIN